MTKSTGVLFIDKLRYLKANCRDLFVRYVFNKINRNHFKSKNIKLLWGGVQLKKPQLLRFPPKSPNEQRMLNSPLCLHKVGKNIYVCVKRIWH